jgi:hypothetical protein
MSHGLENGYDFGSLSIADLLAARDQYHFHLMNKANVVGTAIGRYLIRDKEEWQQAHGHPKPLTTARTLDTAHVRDYSWPCVLVFVSEWVPETRFRAGSKKTPPSKIVPNILYMPDGRAVPVCVVEVKPDTSDDSRLPLRRTLPQHTFGGGLPINVSVQQQDHVATAGCLVSDGSLTYALTARHVCGDPGTELSATLRDGRHPIGKSSHKQVTRVPFNKVYPAFPARQSYLNLDVGLVELSDASDWTCNIYGLAPIKAVYDIYEQNLSFDLLEKPAVAVGAASGTLCGRVKALFYRYRSIGGYDYISDFMIAPEPGWPNSHHGDSGAIWHIDLSEVAHDRARRSGPVRTPPPPLKTPLTQRDLRPFAIQWGGLTFDTAGSDGGRSNFALASSLSNVCKLLDVELVTERNIGASGYWGRVGHFSIARMAIDLVGDAKLSKLLTANADSISFDLDTIKKTSFDKSVGTSLAKGEFAHLADVPDDVWKHWPEGHKGGRKGGRDDRPGVHGSDGPEHPNHYADIDIEFQNKMFRKLCLETPATFLTLSAWQAFYAEINRRIKQAGGQQKKETNEGILPFRVWQFFNELVAFADKGDTTSFVAAAGALAHYVGDACQPLHGSQFGQSDESRPTTTGAVNPKTHKPLKFGDGAHSAYETKMLDHMAPDLFANIDQLLPGKHGLTLVKDGRGAALDIVKLMDDVAGVLDPMEILEAFEQAGGGTRNDQVEKIYNTKKIGERTAKVMVLGVRHLAMIWEAAWTAGGGPKIAQAKLTEIKQPLLRACYERTSFVPSLTIKTLGKKLPEAVGTTPVSNGDDDATDTPAPKKKKAKKAAPAKKAAKKKAAKKKTAKKKKAAKKA